MKIIEKWGTGIPRIFRECEEYGLPEPKLIDFDGDFRVNMYRRIENELAPDDRVNDRVNDKVNNKEPEKAVLSLLMENPEYTVTQLADMLNVSRKTIANKMKVLKERNIIERVGSSRKGYWKIKQ